jgi:hypothetical protein
MYSPTEITSELIEYLKAQKREFRIDETKTIIKEYNKLVLSGTPAIGLFHMTC